MKPFNINEHLEHPDWEVVTREGEPVRVWEDNPGIKCSIIKIEWEVAQ